MIEKINLMLSSPPSPAGNGLVLVVMTRCPSMRTRTNIFLCHLAAADLGVGIICIVPSLLVGILATWFAGPVSFLLVHSDYTCVVYHPLLTPEMFVDDL